MTGGLLFLHSTTLFILLCLMLEAKPAGADGVDIVESGVIGRLPCSEFCALGAEQKKSNSERKNSGIIRFEAIGLYRKILISLPKLIGNLNV